MGDTKTRFQPWELKVQWARAPVQFVSVAAGAHYSAAVSTEGVLWSWGNSGHGRLGQGRDVGHVVQPQAVPAMISSPATMISCGTNVMAAYVPSRLVELVPSSAPVGGGARVKMKGCGLWDTPTLKVKFCATGHREVVYEDSEEEEEDSDAEAAQSEEEGEKEAAPVHLVPLDHEVIVDATYITSERCLVCTCPEFPYTCTAIVEVSTNGVDFSSHPLEFQFYDPPVVESIQPAAAAISGGAVVTIRGSALTLDGSNTACVRFTGSSEINPDGWEGPPTSVLVDAKVVQVPYRRRSSMVVLPPPGGAGGEGKGKAAEGKAGDGAAAAKAKTGEPNMELVLQCTAPSFAEEGFVVGPIDVGVAPNGSDFTSTVMSLYSAGHSGCTPACAPRQGGNILALSGHGFLDAGSQLQVRFSTPSVDGRSLDRFVRGRYVSKDRIECTVPPMDGFKDLAEATRRLESRLAKEEAAGKAPGKKKRKDPADIKDPDEAGVVWPKGSGFEAGSVALSLNGTDYLEAVPFVLYEQGPVAKVEPPCGPASGGTVIKVCGPAPEVEAVVAAVTAASEDSEGKGGEAAADGGDGAEDAAGDAVEGKGGGEDDVAAADGATDAVAEEEAEAPPPAKKKGPEAVPWLFPSAEVVVRLASKGGAKDDMPARIIQDIRVEKDGADDGEGRQFWSLHLTVPPLGGATAEAGSGDGKSGEAGDGEGGDEGDEGGEGGAKAAPQRKIPMVLDIAMNGNDFSGVPTGAEAALMKGAAACSAKGKKRHAALVAPRPKLCAAFTYYPDPVVGRVAPEEVGLEVAEGEHSEVHIYGMNLTDAGAGIVVRFHTEGDGGVDESAEGTWSTDEEGESCVACVVPALDPGLLGDPDDPDGGLERLNLLVDVSLNGQQFTNCGVGVGLVRHLAHGKKKKK